MKRATLAYAGAGAFLTTMLVTVASSLAAAQYSLSGVDTAVSSEVSGNLTILLTIFGSLLALGIILKLVRRFSH